MFEKFQQYFHTIGVNLQNGETFIPFDQPQRDFKTYKSMINLNL